ncbi:MAG: glycosyltransferase family 39 protein [Myxococcota bacterium]|nr:glycosyltransferase family 39 protein [Myxococcota bacterium]
MESAHASSPIETPAVRLAAASWLPMAVLVVVAAGVRLVRWQVTAVLFNDGPVFLAIAEFFREGRFADGFGHPFHPLYPALVALASFVTPDLEAAAIAVSVLGGTAAVVALYAFVKRAFGPTEAWLAAAILAVHPMAVMHAGDVQSEGLYLAFFLGTAACGWRALQERSALHGLCAGLLAGAAYLTRPEGIGIALVFGGLIGLAVLRGAWTFRDGFRVVGALALGLLLTAAPYVAWLSLQSGGPTLSGKKSLGVVTGVVEEPFQGPDPLAANPQIPWVRDADDPAPGTPEARPPRPEPSATAQAADALFDTIQTHFRSLRYELAVVILLGAVVARRRAGLRLLLIGSVVGAYAVVLLLLRWNVGYVSGRHTLPSVALLFGYASSSLLLLGEAAARRYGGRAGRAVALGLLAAIAGLGLGKALRPDRLDALAERRAAEWLREQPVEVRALAARKRRTAYYADAPWVKLATAAFPGGLRKLGASHLILADDDADDYRKLAPLRPPEAREIHVFEAGGETVRVYELWVAPPTPGGGIGQRAPAGPTRSEHGLAAPLRVGLR